MTLYEDKGFIDHIAKTELHQFVKDGKFINHSAKIDINTLYQGLDRFIKAQNKVYKQALQEIKNGRKETHWMWFIFPQRKGLGYSDMSRFYGITSDIEAKNYINNKTLRNRLLEITEEVLKRPESVSMIFGADDIKFKSCMQLFASISDNPIFKNALNKK